MKQSRRLAAFSLFELLCAMAISIVVLSAAVSSYDRYQSRIKHLDGRSKLLEVMQRQHRYFAEHFTYTDRLTLLGFALSDQAVLSDQQYFRIRAAACDSALKQCVRLTATAADGTVLTLDSHGHRTSPEAW